jgi:drug/metabolite transporter (DMT)-like permease
MNTSGKNIGGKIALFGAALIWGGSFLIVKNTMDVIQPHVLIAIRFTIATLLLAIIFHKKLKLLNKDYLISGGIIGLFLFLAYSMQTIGVTDTTPGKNAFLTTIYCVLVPFLNWLIDKKRPDIYNFTAAILIIAGVGLVSLTPGFRIGMGDTFTLAGGVFFALHLVAIAKFRDKDPILLTILQFAYSAVFGWIAALMFEDFPKVWNLELISGLLYLSVLATALALLLQNIGQKYTNPSQASIILCLESVFGVILSVIFYHEVITLRLFAGFLLIFLAVIISETKFKLPAIGMQSSKKVNHDEAV